MIKVKIKNQNVYIVSSKELEQSHIDRLKLKSKKYIKLKNGK